MQPAVIKTFSKVHAVGRQEFTIRGTVDRGGALKLTVERGLDAGIDEEFDAPKAVPWIWERVRKLRAKLGRASIFSPNGFAGLGEDGRRLAVNEIAVLGKAIYDGLFASTPLEGFESDAGIGPVISIKADAISLPWELLYPDPVGEGLDADCSKFLGHRYAFCCMSASKARVPNPYAERMLAADPVRRLETEDGPVEVGRVFDDALPSTADPNQWFTPHLSKLVLEELAVLPSGRDETRAQAAILAFLSEPKDVFQFDCHAEDPGRAGGFSEAVVHIRRGYRASKDHVESWRIAGNLDAIVVLNFCNSNSPVLIGDDSMARGLHKRHARSVIASAAQVSDMFALQFSRELYHRLMLPCPVGRALLDTRRAMIAAYGNPAAFLFGLHGSPTTELEVQGTGAAA